MDTRLLGHSGLELSVIGFGAMTFGGAGAFAAFGQTDAGQARRQLDIVLDAGINLIDTADIYSNGQSEEILGELLGPRRADAVIATKAFGRMGPGVHDIGLSRRHLIAACEASLRRLRTDWIDLFQVHNFDGLVPLDETLKALDDLIRAGKVRYVGCSNFFGWELAAAAGVSERLGLARFVGQQIQYSLLVRDAETEILPAGIALGAGALVWGPLAGGYLSGKFSSGDIAGTRLQKLGRVAELDDARGRRIISALTDIAESRPGASAAQVAINWLLTRPGVTSVLIGATDEAQLHDNIAATSWTLSEAEVAMLDEASTFAAGCPASQRARFHPERNVSPFT